jgi:hypothetical protein
MRETPLGGNIFLRERREIRVKEQPQSKSTAFLGGQKERTII